MTRSRVWSSLLFVVGVALFLVATARHTLELATLSEPTGPLIAFLFDGVPALGIAYFGYWLSDSQIPARGRRLVVGWCLAGGVLFGAVTGVTFLVRAFEGRVVAEPMFPLLVAVEAGAVAGAVAGYYNVRARRDARRARTVGDAMTFVNRLIRHDLRNDLNVIKGHADLLAQSPEDAATEGGDPVAIAEKSREALQHIETTNTIAETLVGDPDLEPIDLVAPTSELADHVEDAFGATVETDLPDEALVVANAGIRSIVDNLLENAVEHTDAGDPRVAVAVDADGDTVQLTVSDDGPGIPPEQRQALFESAEADPGGGLSLVRALVDVYGGDVWVDETGPTGSTFVVELPRAANGASTTAA